MHSMGCYGSRFQRADSEDRSDWTDAQADLSLSGCTCYFVAARTKVLGPYFGPHNYF